MDVMMNIRAKPPSRATEGRSLRRLEFELALEIGDAVDHPPEEALRRAARSAGADLVVMLPATGGVGTNAVVRVVDDSGSHFLQVMSGDDGFLLVEEDDIEASLLAFARVSIDVLERLKADRAIVAPLMDAAH